jgi:hypothetical protein
MSTSLTDKQIASIKTCTELSANPMATPQNNDTITSSKFDAPAMRAAFLKGNILRAHTILKCAFMQQPPINLIRSDTAELMAAVDDNGVSIPVDPIQLEVDEMDIIPGIIHIVEKRIQPIVNIKFSFYEDEENKKLWNPNVADIRISFNPNGGAWALLGKDVLKKDIQKKKEEATMNFGWFDAPTVIHEFCHALAMTHEHQNPLGKPINWNVNAVYEYYADTQKWPKAETEKNILKKYEKDQINGSEYDSKSIMLYFFSDTLVNDDQGNCCGKGAHQNYQFSPLDVLFLNKIYPTKGQKLTPAEFTVKFFNDTFNQKVDIETLKTQVRLNDEREEKAGGPKPDDDTDDEKEKFDDVVVAQNAIQPTNSNKKENYCCGKKEKKAKRRKKCSNNNSSSYFITILAILLFIVLGCYLIFYCMSSTNNDTTPLVENSKVEIPKLKTPKLELTQQTPRE